MIDLEARIASLEHQVAAYRRTVRLGGMVVAGILFGGSSLLLFGAAPADQVLESVRTSNLLVVDQQGRTRARLGEADGAVALELYDTKGTSRLFATLRSEQGMPVFGLSDSTGRVRAGVQVGSEGASFDLRDSAGTIRASIASAADGSGRIGVAHKTGDVAFQATATGLGMWYRADAPAFSLAVAGQNSPSMAIFRSPGSWISNTQVWSVP